MRHALADILLAAGVAVQLMGCLGVLLMRAPLDRVHYAGASTAAALLLAAAVVMRDSFSLIGNKAVVLAAFVLVTAPVLGHVTARAIHHAGARR
jgi:multicomponent Na+:H+ antiporter subunit G